MSPRELNETELLEVVSNVALPMKTATGPLSEEMSSDDFTASTIGSLSDTEETESFAAVDASSSSSSSPSTSSGEGRSVRFGQVEIREYNRIVGDHPDVRVGPPMGIGWEYASREAQDIDDYESSRPEKRKNLRLSSITRKNMLHNVFEIPEAEIRSAEKEVQRIKKRRDSSNKQGKTGAKVESAVRSFSRRLRKRLTSENVMKGFAAAAGSMPSMTYMHH